MESDYYSMLRELTKPMLIYRDNKEFSNIELFFGCCSFLNWKVGLDYLKNIDNDLANMYLDYNNKTARLKAIDYCIRLYGIEEVLDLLKSKVNNFNPNLELSLADPPITPHSPYWNIWKSCFTRSIILITRALVYSYCNYLGFPITIGFVTLNEEDVNFLQTESYNLCLKEYKLSDTTASIITNVVRII